MREEQILSAEKEDYSVSFNTLYWEDVREGDMLPKVSLELTRDRMVMIVCGTRDIFPLHHDDEFARSMGYTAAAAPITFLQGLLGRCLTDWAGPKAKIRKVSLTLMAPNYQGDTINVDGNVIRKYVDDINHKIDCELVVTKQDGTVSAKAQAVVTIPARGKGK